jgi:precorrin-6B C5,15-methyltransferase / cobalt-precorrin-6B C5,C15-methyltransferase
MAEQAPVQRPVTVIGLADDRFELLAPEARHALDVADVVVGGHHHLMAFVAWASGHSGAAANIARQSVEVGPDVDETVRAVRRWAVDAGRRVCVLAPGDPGFFGMVRTLLRGVDRSLLHVVPATPTVAVAFARLGLPWDDALVVSAAERTLPEVVGMVRTSRKAAVLTSPTMPPEALGAALLRAGATLDLVAVCSRLGAATETVTELALPELAAGRFDPGSVVVLIGPGGLPLIGWGPGPAGGSWGLPEPSTEWSSTSRSSDIRAVLLHRLALPVRGVLWDLAANGESLAVDCAIRRPDLTVLAVEPDPDAAAQLTGEATARGAAVHVVSGSASASLDRLPDPDRAHVVDDVEAIALSLRRLRPGGRVVARLGTLDRAVAAADLLGSVVQLQLSPAERTPAGWQLLGTEPVFVAWGPA